MIFRRLLLALAAATLLRAAPPEITGDRQETELGSALTVFRGHVRFADPALLLTCDELAFDGAHDTATATGRVVLTRGDERLLADRLVLDRRTQSFTAERVRFGRYPFYVEGASASGTRDEVAVARVTLSYREPGPWQPTVVADRLVYNRGQKVRTENSRAGIGDIRPLPLPRFEQGLDEPVASYLSLTGGFRSSLGAFAEAGLRLPVSPEWRLGGDLGLYTARGLMAGPAGRYASADDGAWRGHFRSGFIRDHGKKLFDLLGRPVPANRGYAEWQHEQILTENLSLSAQFNYWRDSEVLRDFRPGDFFAVQAPDSFVESSYRGHNYLVSAFVRAQPNRFHDVQRRLPELRLDVPPLPVGAGFVGEFSASFARLREAPPLGGVRLASDRLDARYALMRPFTPREWLAVTPVAGARLTRYANTEGATRPGGVTRALGELGVDALLRASSTWDYDNPQWGIHGLRHLVTPRLGWRNITGGDSTLPRIPQIDRAAFSTYLPPLGLGATRNLDDLRATNILRLGLDHTLQTRAAGYGSRDLIAFNTAADFHLRRRPGEGEHSAIHSELAVTPAPWLAFEFYERFQPSGGGLHEFNSAITLRDGDAWSLRFANNFLRGEIQDYRVEARVRCNEVFEFLSRLQYDARRGRFNEQAYGLVQNLSNTWLLSYVVTLHSGRSRETPFGFNVQVEATGF